MTEVKGEKTNLVRVVGDQDHGGKGEEDEPCHGGMSSGSRW